jgi:biopolymer transport protein ExbD
LIYFLITSTFRPNEGQIPGTLPQKGVSAVQEHPRKPVRIVLRPRGVNREFVQYEVDNLPPVDKPEQLFRVLERRRKAVSDEIPVVIKPWANVRWRYVVEAFNASVRARFKNIGFGGAQ